LRSKYWNEIDCEIIESDININRIGNWSYNPIISYRFNVNGFDYEGNKIKYGGTGATKSAANAYCEKYPIGKIVRVHFDPMNHNRSVLEPGHSWRIFGMIILFLLLEAWGLTGVLDMLQANH
jgi:hypothetical protein